MHCIDVLSEYHDVINKDGSRYDYWEVYDELTDEFYKGIINIYYYYLAEKKLPRCLEAFKVRYGMCFDDFIALPEVEKEQIIFKKDISQRLDDDEPLWFE